VPGAGECFGRRRSRPGLVSHSPVGGSWSAPEGPRLASTSRRRDALTWRGASRVLDLSQLPDSLVTVSYVISTVGEPLTARLVGLQRRYATATRLWQDRGQLCHVEVMNAAFRCLGPHG